MNEQTRHELLYLSPIELKGGIQYPLVSLKVIFPNMQDVGVPFEDNWSSGLGKVSYRNIIKMLTYHDTYQS